MKTLKTILAVSSAVLVAMALLASPASAALGVPDATPSAPLYQTPVNDTKTKLNPPFQEGQQFRLYANFAGGVRDVTFYKETTPDNWVVVGTDEANSSGNAYLPVADAHTVIAGPQRFFAEDEFGEETEIDTINGEPAPPPPPPGSATLTPSSDGKKFTATFSPKVPGQSAKLEVQEICTYETDETDPAQGEFDKDVKQGDCVGPRRTVATAKQDSNGTATFSLSDPLEVEHKYFATSGTATSDVDGVKFAAPLPTKPYGIDTGLSELHFNTYEGENVNTRERYFEGAFSMTASEKNASPAGTPCAEAKDGTKTAIMKSTMKGRGNYSWSFPKKSFTLKVDKKMSLCGLGVSKKYALVANDYDKSLLRNSLASFVGQKFSNMGWTPKAVPVEFYMNGNYRGSYLLIERISIQGPKTDDTYSSRLDLDELKDDGQRDDPDHPNNKQPNITGGYVMEWDYRRGADYNVNLGSDSGWVGIKDPENDRNREDELTDQGISPQQKSYISSYLNSADNAVRGNKCQSGAWDDWIDKDSAVDYYIAMEFMKPVDGNMWASVNMYKPRGEKIHFGPMWDFDMAAGSATRAGNVASPSSFYLRNNLQVSAMQPESATKKPDTWFNCLNKRSSFRNAVEARWNEVQNLSGLNVSGFLNEQRDLISASATANFKRWSHSSRISPYQVIKSSWSSDVSHLKSWASARRSWLNGSSGF